MILETPKEGPRDDRNNLALIRALLESGDGWDRNEPLRPIDQGKG